MMGYKTIVLVHFGVASWPVGAFMLFLSPLAEFKLVLWNSYQRMIAPLRTERYVASMATQTKAKLVAIVDDDELMRSALQGMLKSVGFRSQAFESAEEFLNSGQQRQTACLIVDIRMPGMSGLELQAKLNAEHCRIPTIFITAHGDTKMRMQALRAGAVEFLAKPFDDEVLLDSVRAALEN